MIVVAGAKKVGKSTFARLLVNTMLNHVPCVAFLETGARWLCARVWTGGVNGSAS